MANERIKAEVTPISAETVGETIKSVLPTEVKEQKLKQKIYVGPNLLELPTYTVVESEFTPHIKEVIKKCPSVAKLFIPIEEMAHVESRSKEKGTLEHRHYNKVIAYRNGEDE